MQYVRNVKHDAAKGFTFLELMVVMSLVAILAGFFTINTQSSREAQRVEVAASQLVSYLRQAQTWGESGRAYGVADDEQFDRGYGVYIADGAASLVSYGGLGNGLDAGGNDEPSEDEYDSGGASNLVETYALPNNVTVSDICVENPGGNCVNRNDVHILARRGEPGFSIHAQGGAFTNSPYTEITLTSGAFAKTVRVNMLGLIYAE